MVGTVGGEPTEFVLCAGEPTRFPCYKYVGYGGGLIARSVEKVELKMQEYEKDPAK